jgi:hypothetical protein
MSYGSDFILTLFTNDPELAARADAAGVDRIGPDLEIIGKRRRQGHLNTRISAHTVADLATIRPRLTNADLFVRTNPIHPGLPDEIERVIGEGAAVVMLPMFTSPEEVAAFLRLVDGRARTVLLLETAQATARIDEILALGGFDEMHIGLNDLYLSTGLRNQFEVLCSDVLESACAKLRAAGIRFGLAGIGRAGDTALPIPSELVYPQYPRLGARGAIVSRVFFSSTGERDLAADVADARARLDHFAALLPAVLAGARTDLRHAVAARS